MNTQALNSRSEHPNLPFESIGPFFRRMPQKHSLAGARVVSADNHISLGGRDIWREAAPAHLKERVPRVWFDEDKQLWNTTLGGESLAFFGADDFARSMEGRRGAWDVDARVADMDAEGVEKEIVFPQFLLRLCHLPDLEAREFIFREYNRYLCELQRRQPGRFYGVGVAHYWEPERARDSILEGKKNGLKAFMVPCRPGVYPDGTKIFYGASRMDPLWEAFEETNMPVCFHVGEGTIHGGPGAIPVSMLINLGAPDFRMNWSEMVFGGVFDRHPSLRVAFVEGGLHWIPGMLQDAEMLREALTTLLDYTPKLPLRDYWAKHCVATFMYDPAGILQLDVIGLENVMWSVDYPHNEGSFGYSGEAIQHIVDRVGATAARKIVGDNALRFFDL